MSATQKSLDELATEIKETMGETWIATQYTEKILPMRTRSFRLPLPPSAKTRIEIQHTLLGVELKIGNQRVSCPDLATARYLAIWARLGCSGIAVPYDISQISRLADELESAWHRMLLLVAHLANGRSANFQTRLRTTLVNQLRLEIESAGVGPAVPEFKQSTKQRTAAS